jgi:chromosome segregation ATPase
LLELSSDKRAVDQMKDGYEVRSHVLSLREGELDSRLRERERTYAELEAQLRTLTTLLKKEQKTRQAQASRIQELEARLARQFSRDRPRPPVAISKRSKASVKPVPARNLKVAKTFKRVRKARH